MPKHEVNEHLEGIADGNSQLSGRTLVMAKKAYINTQAHVSHPQEFSQFLSHLTTLMQTDEHFVVEAGCGDVAVFCPKDPMAFSHAEQHAVLGALMIYAFKHKKTVVFDHGGVTTMMNARGDLTQHPTPMPLRDDKTSGSNGRSTEPHPLPSRNVQHM